MRVFLGRDPETGAREYTIKTVRGSFREAQTDLKARLQEARQRASARSQ